MEFSISFTKGNVYPDFRQKRKGEELFLNLLCLSGLQFKIILKPKWHILGCHILAPLKDVVSIPKELSV